MRQKSSWFVNIVVVMTDIAFINTIYFSISIVKTPFLVGYLPWFLCGLCGFFINSLFLKKPRTIPALFGLNALLFAAEAGLLLYFSADRGGIWFYLALFSALLVTVSRESYLVLHPPSPQQRLLYAEASFFVTLWLYFLQISSYQAPASYNAVMFAVLLLNIASLIQYRISDESGSTLGLFKGWAVLIFGGIFLSLALLLALFSGFSGLLRTATYSVLLFAGAALRAILLFAGRAIEFLFSLFPDPKVDPDTLQPPLSIPERAAENSQLNPAVIEVLLVLLAVAALALIAYILYHLRNTKLPAVFGGERLSQAKAKREKNAVIRRLIRAALFQIRFFFLSLLYRATPVGLLLSLERLGKEHKLPRAPGETNRLYIGRMAAAFDLFSGEETLPLFRKLADELDYGYFGRNGRSDNPSPLSSAEIVYLRKKIRKVNRTLLFNKRRKVRSRREPAGSGEGCP